MIHFRLFSSNWTYECSRPAGVLVAGSPRHPDFAIPSRFRGNASLTSIIENCIMDAQNGASKRAIDDQIDEDESKTKEKRTSRACLTCRKRKTACHL